MESRWPNSRVERREPVRLALVQGLHSPDQSPRRVRIHYRGFGRFTPLIASSIVAGTHNNFAGLYYPIAVALMTFVIGSFFLPEMKSTKIWDEVGGEIATVRAAGD